MISGATEMEVPLICQRPPYTFRHSSRSASDVNRFVIILLDDDNDNDNNNNNKRQQVRPAAVMSSIADQSLAASSPRVYCVISLTENLKKNTKKKIEQRKKSKRCNIYYILCYVQYIIHIYYTYASDNAV